MVLLEKPHKCSKNKSTTDYAMSTEEDTYNIIFKAMQHPIRRRILRTLSEAPSTYTEIQRTLNIDNGLLNYHLDNMRDLLTKNEEEKYTLSEFGRATVNLVSARAMIKAQNGVVSFIIQFHFNLPHNITSCVELIDFVLSNCSRNV
ncbi:MAG: helix-turn-helix domain-containing protein [Candidatus Bathyarchaeota archaeon]|nr:helix-turn-helix domain-containing protein [Candidatus Bathyarchaeota archaeon]